MAKHPADYRPQWQAYARRQNRLWLVFLGSFALLIGLASLWPKAGPMFMFVWLFGNSAWYSRLKPFLCPRCHKPFFRKNGWENTFTGKYLHCGLPKRADYDIDAL